MDFQEELRYQYLGRRDSNKRTIYDADAELGDNERWVRDYHDLDAMDKHPAIQQCRQYGSSEQYVISRHIANNILMSLDNARKVLEPLREELCMDDYTLF